MVNGDTCNIGKYMQDFEKIITGLLNGDTNIVLVNREET